MPKETMRLIGMFGKKIERLDPGPSEAAHYLDEGRGRSIAAVFGGFIKKNMPVLGRGKPLQNLCQRFHRQPNHIGHAPFHYLNVRIMIFLDGISAGTAFPLSSR
jgi:hypothetical protein